MKIPVIYAGLKERKREMKKYMGGGMAVPTMQMAATKKPATMMAKGGSVKQMKTCAGCPNPAACAKAGKCLMAGKTKMAKGGMAKKPAAGVAIMIAMPAKKGKK